MDAMGGGQCYCVVLKQQGLYCSFDLNCFSFLFSPYLRICCMQLYASGPHARGRGGALEIEIKHSRRD